MAVMDRAHVPLVSVPSSLICSTVAISHFHGLVPTSMWQPARHPIPERPSPEGASPEIPAAAGSAVVTLLRVGGEPVKCPASAGTRAVAVRLQVRHPS